MCFSIFTIPFLSASKFSPERSAFCTPPLYFSARTVATKTTQSGLSPALRHLISKNFSAPRSAPNPASVTTMSASLSPAFVALTLLQPWAIFANGPPCTIAGVCSSVWIRFGFTASFNSAAIAPAAFKSPAVTGSPPNVYATIMLERRRFKSAISSARQRIAIISDATVITK